MRPRPEGQDDPDAVVEKGQTNGNATERDFAPVASTASEPVSDDELIAAVLDALDGIEIPTVEREPEAAVEREPEPADGIRPERHRDRWARHPVTGRLACGNCHPVPTKVRAPEPVEPEGFAALDPVPAEPDRWVSVGDAARMTGLPPGSLHALRRRGELTTCGLTKGELDAKSTAAGWEAQDRGLVLPAGRTRRGSPPGVYFRLHELAELAPDAEPPPRPSSRALLTDRERERADQYRRLMAPEGDGA